jgi:Holliday junction resolvase RusA-like endonuclease
VVMVVCNKRRHDIDSGIKVLLDSIASACGWDDNLVVELAVKKVLHRGGKPRLVVTVEHAAQGEYML